MLNYKVLSLQINVFNNFKLCKLHGDCRENLGN